MATVEVETTKTLVEGDVSCLSTELAKSQTVMAGSRAGSESTTGENGVRVSATNEEGLNGEMDSGDGGVGVVTRRVVETKGSVETIFGGQDIADLGGGKERINGLDSVLGMEKNEENGVKKIGGQDNSTVLIGDGSDKKVEFNGNGISLVVEVCGSLGNGNEGEKTCGREDDTGSLTENGGVSGGKSTEMPDSFSKLGKKCDITAETGQKQQVNANGEENEDGDSEDVGDQDHEYLVGDFVWGKIRSHPWWPGQIYDSSDASEYAAKYSQKDRRLVAYFGDGSFSWCNPLQLKPFAENFGGMSKQSNSKNFVNAVYTALDEIGRLVELEMTCLCIPVENQTGIARPVNAGIKAGVLVPAGGTGKLLISQHEPTELLANLRCIAQGVSISNLLEFTVLKSSLTAFYRAKGGYSLPIYHEPKYIEGLEDKNQKGVIDIADFSDPVKVPIQGPPEEAWLSSSAPRGFIQSNQSMLQKCPEISGDKLYQRRKQKSVAELMGEDLEVESEGKKGSLVKGREIGKSISGKKKKKGNDEAESEGNIVPTSPSGRKRGRKKKDEVSGSPKATENRVSSVDNGGVVGEGDKKVGRDNGTQTGKSTSGKKKRKGNDEAESEGNIVPTSPSGMRRGRKKKVEVSGSPITTANRVLIVDNGGLGGEEGDKKVGRDKGTQTGKTASGKKRRKANDEAENQGIVPTSPSGRTRGRKKKDEVSGSPKTTQNRVSIVDNGGVGGEEGGKKVGTDKGTQNGMSISGKKRRQVNDEAEGEGIVPTSPSGRTRGRKKKDEVSGSPKTTENRVSIVDNGGIGGKEGGKKVGTDKGTQTGKSTSGKKRRKGSDEAESEGNIVLTSPSGRKRGRKKKVEVSGSPKTTENRVSIVDNDAVGGKEANESHPSTEWKRKKVSSIENDDGEAKEETVKSSALRERKKSKYLSPPYTNHKWRIKNSSSKKDSETESEKIADIVQMGKRMTRAAAQIIQSPSILKCSTETFQKEPAKEHGNGHDASGSSSPRTAKHDHKKSIDSVIEVNANEVLSEIWSAALNPLCSMEKKHLDMVTGFISTLRSSIFLNGSNYKMYHNVHSRRAGRKRKSSNSDTGPLGIDLNQTDNESSHPISQQKGNETDEQAKSGVSKAKHSARGSGKKTNDKELDRKDSPVTLILTFPPGFSLPSKDNLINIFSKFGALNEMETDVFYNSMCARVVFERSSDAEEAFSILVEKSPFGAANVNYRLRYSSVASRANELHQKAASPIKKTPEKPAASQPTDDEASQLRYVRQKLQKMTSMLGNGAGRISPELKSNLEREMKGLLEKVSTMAESTSS